MCLHMTLRKHLQSQLIVGSAALAVWSWLAMLLDVELEWVIRYIKTVVDVGVWLGLGRTG